MLKLGMMAAFMGILCPGDARAATITSSNFSVTFGATYIRGAAVSWTTSESATLNTATTAGDFSFIPVIPSA
jgi:hypothetical protein